MFITFWELITIIDKDAQGFWFCLCINNYFSTESSLIASDTLFEKVTPSIQLQIRISSFKTDQIPDRKSPHYTDPTYNSSDSPFGLFPVHAVHVKKAHFGAVKGHVDSKTSVFPDLHSIDF